MKDQKKYIILILVTVFISLIALLGTSYAILTMKLTSSKKISIVTGVLKVDFNDGDHIKLENETPTTDEKALAKTPYTFTIENTGNLDAYYKISMEEELTNTLDKKYLKMRLTSDNGYDSGIVKLSDYESNNYDITDIATLKTTDNKITYNLWIWLGSNATNAAQGKEYKSKIVVTSFDRDPEQDKPVKLAAGLYAEDGTMTYSWQELIDEDIIKVADGELKYFKDVNNNLTGKLVIDNSIKSIWNLAFCTAGPTTAGKNLTEIVIPSGITTIPIQAFAYCTSLKTITIPDSVMSISVNAFQECTNLTTIYYSGTATGSPWGATNATIKPYNEAPAELLPSNN